MKKKQKKIYLFWFGIALAAIALLTAEQFYRFRICNFWSRDGQPHAYYVLPNVPADSLLSHMRKDYRLASVVDWHLHRLVLGYKAPKPGYYLFPSKVGSGVVIRMLMHGQQTPVRLTWTNQIRTREQLAGRLAKQLMMDSTDIICRLDSNEYMQKYGLKRETAVCMFLPNTYEVYWTMTPDELFDRMKGEYDRFWNEERQHKADSLHLTREEIATLASIVESETHRTAEHPAIASLYLNRLRKGMRLQACPTVIFATGNFKLRRVLGHHLNMDSPYNTYRYAGLPPGPIRCSNGTAIDAVLNAPKTGYIFMCANPDFSGTHVFSSTYAQHAATAVRYRQALNARDIH